MVIDRFPKKKALSLYIPVIKWYIYIYFMYNIYKYSQGVMFIFYIQCLPHGKNQKFPLMLCRVCSMTSTQYD